MKKLLFALSAAALLAAGCSAPSSQVSGQPTTAPTATSTAAPATVSVLSSPGSLTVKQLAAYPRCDSSAGKTGLPQSYTCGTGKAVGYYYIAKSINLDGTVSFYVYTVQPAQSPGETWSPTVSTYAANDFLSNQCGTKISLQSVDYQQQNFTVVVSAGDGTCPE